MAVRAGRVRRCRRRSRSAATGWPKVGILAGLSLVTAAWYPILQAELYRSLPGRSGIAVSLLSAAGLVGGLGPLAIGLLAGQLGLGRALALLITVPVAVLAGAGWRVTGWRGPRHPAAPPTSQPSP